LRSLLVRLLSPEDFRFVWSPFLLNHAVVGILLIPLGLSTVYCASVGAGAWGSRMHLRS
jgi:hypothetical protein